MQLHAKNRQGPLAAPEAGKRKDTLILPGVSGRTILLAPPFWTSRLSTVREHIGVVLDHTACVFSYGNPRELMQLASSPGDKDFLQVTF